MGLMPTPTQGGAPPMDPQGGPPADAGQEEQPNVSPEEQQQYEMVVKKAADIIYGDGKVMPEILKSLEPAKDAPSQGGGTQDAPPAADGEEAAPAESDQQQPSKGGNPAVLALANTATQVVQKLDSSSRDAGINISDEVLYHAGAEIVEMLAEVAEAANIHNYSENEIQGAFYQAIDNYRPIAERMGRTDDQTLKGQFGEIVQADEQGKLGEILPGLDSQQPSEGQPPAEG